MIRILKGLVVTVLAAAGMGLGIGVAAAADPAYPGQFVTGEPKMWQDENGVWTVDNGDFSLSTPDADDALDFYNELLELGR